MTVSKYATQAGRKYETDLLKYLREFGHDVERLRLAGAEDEGDLLVRPVAVSGPPRGPSRFVIEAKRTKSLDLSGWVKEAETEADNYARHRGLDLTPPGFLAVHYARGKGIGKSYVTTTLDEWLSWL